MLLCLPGVADQLHVDVQAKKWRVTVDGFGGEGSRDLLSGGDPNTGADTIPVGGVRLRRTLTKSLSVN
jgi:hypothetical protein